MDLVLLRVLMVISPALLASSDGVNIQPVDPVLFENQSLNLTCIATSASPLTFSWLRDGVSLPGENESVLSVLSVPVEWEGSVLVCVVEGVGNSSVTLTVRPASPVFTEHPLDQTVDKGSQFNVSCSATGYPTPRIVWYKDGSVYGLADMFDPDSVGRLVFLEAIDEHAGVYQCQATNKHDSLLSQPGTVSVRSPPEFTVQPEDITVLNNTAASFNCSAKGNPPPTITWLHNGERVTPSVRVTIHSSDRVIHSNGTLVIDPVTMMDCGVYHCVANNSLGSEESDGAMLIVHLFPQFVSIPQDTTAALGDQAILNCSAMAIPTAEYDWTRDGVEWEPDGVRVWRDIGSLVFNRVIREDSGSYICTASNVHGRNPSDPAKLDVTGPPRPPAVDLEGVGATWLSLSWTPHEDDHPAVSHYSIRYKLALINNGYMERMENGRAVNLTALYPHADYVLQVVSVSPAGSSEPNVTDTRTLPGLPPDMNSPDVLLIELTTSPHHLLVRWTVPQELLVTSYSRTRVYLMDKEGSEVIVEETSGSSVNLTNLTAATSYTVEAEFLFVGGHIGPRTRRDIMTSDGIPSSPENITVEVGGPHTLTVTWSPPTQPNGNITAYTLVVTPSVRMWVADGNDRTLTITGLRAYTNYTVSLTANTSAGEGESTSRDIRTAEDVPPPPTGLNVDPKNSTALLLSWQPLENVPGVLRGYIVTIDQTDNVTLDPNTISFLLTGLMPYTLYQVIVAGTTGAGTGNFSDPVDERTLSDVPTSVPRITDVDQSCPNDLVVTWMNFDPSGLNGPPDQTQLVVGVVSLSENFTRHYNYSLSGNGSFVIENVTHYTVYNISVALRNDNGTGGYSSTESIQSCDALAGPPSNVSVEAVDSTSIRVTWQPVGEIPGMLVNYVVIYSNESSAQQRMNATPTSNSTLLTGLTPYSLYSVRVASVTRSGEGTPSTNVSSMTPGDVPTSVPTIISVNASCPNDFVVTWNSDPSGLNGPLNQTQLVVNVTLRDDTFERTFDYSVSNQGMLRVSDLKLNTTYSLTLALRNSNGTGPYSSLKTAHTLTEGVSTPPRNLLATTISSTAIKVSWQRPLNPNGDPHYLVSYRHSNKDKVIIAMDETANLTGLDVFTDYEIAVSANTSCGPSNKSKVFGQTPPTEPVNLRVIAVLPTALVVEWAEPVGNGTVDCYQVTCGDAPPVATAMRSYECTGLEPETGYAISVSANNSGGTGPPISMANRTACRDTEWMVEAGNNNTLVVSLSEPPAQRNCTRVSVLYVLVLVQELVANGNGGYIPPTCTLANYSLEELLESTSNHGNSRSKRQSRATVYIAANVSEMELQGDGIPVGDGKEYGGFRNHALKPGVFYIVGLRGTVARATTPIYVELTDSNPITAAPPPPTTLAPPMMTTAFPTTSAPPMTTTAFPILAVAVSAGAAAALLFAILLVACIICACSYCNRRANKYIVSNGTGQRDRTSSFRLSAKRKASDPVDEFRANHRTEALEDHPPVPVVGFINKLMVMRTNDNQLFLEEFGSISSTPQHSTEVADSNANKRRNRYNNILPYDNNRVKLKSHGGSDYINASYCSGYMKNKAYIATQGPIAETVGDFWRLVWEENVRTIIMLTNVQEKGKVKCEMYWPRDLGCSSLHGHIEVIMDQVTQLADFTIRTFSLHKAGSSKEGRRVKQFHFTSWPDHGVPQYATAMLSMLRRVRSYHSKVSGGPMLVHCSAGVGRTGTFIVIDSMLERLKNSDLILDIYGHVTLLRTERNCMVQTEDQYFFIHEAIAEALLCGNTEVSLEGLGAYISELGAAVPNDDSTHIEVQFKRLAIDKTDPYRYLTANKDANKPKNRLVNILPYESNRVVLEYLRGVDGSDYINASHIDSYHNRRAFIATQAPLPHTTGDFWRMIWQCNSPVIVMLTELVEKGQERCSQYWPSEVLQSERYDRFNVELAVERHSEHYTFRDISITDPQSGAKRSVSHFQFHGWPEVGIPTTPTILLDFIREVQKMHSSLNTKAPITVHCSSGVGRTGVFITLHITIERMSSEGLVDIFQTVKNLRIQRPAMVQSLRQYQFCYESALHYLESSDLLTRQRSAPELSRKRSVRHTPPSSQASPARNTTGTTPSRTDSFKGSSRNFEVSGNHGAQIYGGSEATSTFGSHHHTTTSSLTPTPVSGSQTLATQLGGSQSHLSPLGGSQSHLPYGGSQSHLGSYGNSASQQSGGSQSPLQRYGGSQSQLTAPPHAGVHVRNTSVGGVGGHVPHQLAESQRYSNCSGGWGAETQ